MRKKVIYDWYYGQEELFLKVDSYAYGDGLYVGMCSIKDGQIEPFGDLTVNIPLGPMEYNEALIEDMHSKDKMNLFEKYELGEVLPTTRSSGYAIYSMVAFDLDRLAEYDPEGVDRFKNLHGITEKSRKHRKAKKHEER